jgi:hypothetical protein
MSLRNRKERALAENSMLRFLVECCEEGPDLEEPGVALQDAYLRFWRKQQESDRLTMYRPDRLSYLSNGNLYTLLLESGFTKLTREARGPKGGVMRVTYFRGLRLKQEVKQAQPDPKYIRINDGLYSRDEIAQIRPIRGFLRISKNGEGEEMMKAIVTFKHNRTRHQFVSAEEAGRITAQLTGESQ